MLSIWLLALAVWGFGCSKGRITEYRLGPTGLTSEDKIAVILNHPPPEHYWKWWKPSSFAQVKYSPYLENRVAWCVQYALEDMHSTVRIVPSDKLREIVFPDLSPEEIPPGDSSWEQLAGQPGFQERIALLGLRYLIEVSVWQKVGAEVEFGQYLGVYGTVENYSQIRATVVDILKARSVGEVVASGTGTSHLLGWLVPIIPVWITWPKGRACDELGKGVAKFLAGESLSEETEGAKFEEGGTAAQDEDSDRWGTSRDPALDPGWRP